MALSIEQQRRYARMLTPEQLANYVKNPDMGNEIGITPSVFAEAIAEINAEDQEPQPAASNTVIDRQVNEMLGGRSQGLGGSTSQQFSHGGIIPGYQVGGHLGPTTPSNDFLQMVLNQPEIKNAMTKTSAKGGLPRLVSQVFSKHNPYAYYLLAMLGLPEEVGYSDEDREAFLRRPDYPMLKKIREVGVGNLKGMEDSEWARKAGGYSTGHDDQGMDFDKPSIWERIKEMYQGPIGRASGGIITGYQNGGDVNPDKPLSTRELYEQRQKELGQAQGYSELDRLSTPGTEKWWGTSYALPDLLKWSQAGGTFEGFQKLREEIKARGDRGAALERYNAAQAGKDLTRGGFLKDPDRGLAKTITAEDLEPFGYIPRRIAGTSQEQVGRLAAESEDVYNYLLQNLGNVDYKNIELPFLKRMRDRDSGESGILDGTTGTSGSIDVGDPTDGSGVTANLLKDGIVDEKDDDIRQGKEVAKKVEEGILVDVPDSNFADHITRIENLMDEPLKPEQQDLLDKLEGRTAITDRISELEGSREGDYEEYLQNRFFNALANIARPGGLGASLSASDSAYSREQDDLENILADLKMQGEAQDIDAARVAAEFSTLGDRYVPALLDAGLAGIQDEAASARHAADLNLKRYEIQKTLEARIPTAIEQQFRLLDALQKAKADEDLMMDDPNLEAAIDQRLSMLLPLLMGSVNIEAQDEE